MQVYISIIYVFLLTICNGATVSRVVGNTCSSSSPCDVGEFCNAIDMKCASIDYNPVVSTSNEAASTGTEFSFAMISDVQFYYRVCKDNPISDCVFEGRPVPRRVDILKRATTRQLNCVADMAASDPNLKAVFHNGDITNAGLDIELTDIIDYVDKPVKDVMQLPYVPALGNHDYGSAYTAESRVRMVNYLAAELATLHSGFKIRNIDFERSDVISNALTARTERYTKGSLSYSIEINDYVFIILHWATSIEMGGIFVDTVEADLEGFTDIIEITSVETWLVNEINANIGKKIFLVPHSRRGLEKFISATGIDGDLDGKIEGVLAGHDHDNWGYYADLVYGGSTPIPLYYAGSASYERFIMFNVDSTGSWSVTPIDSSIGSCAATGNDNDDSTPTPTP